jgi:hypothetical protein
MKMFFKNPLLAFTLMTLALVSCSDDSDDNKPAITAPVGKVSATIGSTSFEGAGGAQISNDEIVVGAISGDHLLSIFVTKAAAVGTYEVKGAQPGVTPDAEINYSPDGVTLYSSVFALNGEKVGTVTIVEIDEANKTISGTFSTKVLSTGGSLEVSGSFNKIPFTNMASNSLTAKIDGTSFTATAAFGQSTMGIIALNGQTLNGSKIITVSFDEDISTGTYAIGEIGDDVYATFTTDLVNFVSSTGTLTITKHDKSASRIEGTFSFEAVPFFEEGDGHNITEGSFAITYN